MIALAAVAARAEPMPGWTRNRSELRRLECAPIDAREGENRYPGRIVTSQSRAVDPEKTVMVCTERVVRPGLRAPADERVLDALAPISAALAAQVASADLAGRTLLVEVFHPSTEVSWKVAFAVKDALVGQGLPVSDRPVRLAAGDVDVLTRLPPFQAYDAACKRYADSGGLGPGDALVLVVRLDPRETGLHGALCVDGGLTWLR